MDAAKAGNRTMTVVVSDIQKTRQLLKDQGTDPGQAQQGEFGKIVQLRDPDGSSITFAEAPKGSAKQSWKLI